MTPVSNMNDDSKAATMGRREFMGVGAALSATPLLGGVVSAAQDSRMDASVGSRPSSRSGRDVHVRQPLFLRRPASRGVL